MAPPSLPPSERELFHAVHRRMRALAGFHAADVDDLAQLAAEQVFRKLPTFRGESELMTWVYGICYRVLLKERRWYKRWSARFRLQEPEERVEAPAPSPHAALEVQEGLRALHVALAGMSEKYRAVVVLHDLEELSIAEVAQIVSCNELTARSRLRDGRKQLRRLLEATEQGAYGGQHELTHY